MNTDKTYLLLVKKLTPYLFLLTGISVLTTFIWLGQYAHPSADDYCMASGVKHEGLFHHLWNHYFEWSGRYTGNALYAVYPLVFGLLDGIKYMPAILIFLLLGSCIFFISQLFRLSILNKTVFLIALVVVIVYLLGIKHTASSLFWPAGALSYQTANILFFITLGLIIRLADLQHSRQNYFFILIALVLVTFLGMGTNETNMLALSAILILAFTRHLFQGWEVLKPWLFILTVAFICFLIVYLAPGNTIRESTFPLKHDLNRAIKGSLDMGAWVLTGWLLNPLFIVATLLTPLAVARLNYLSNRTFSVSNFSLTVFILGTLSIPFVLQFPAWWAMGGWPPPRTVDAIFFVFMLSWFTTIGAITIRFAPSDVLAKAGNEAVNRWALVYFCGAVLLALAVLINFKFQRAQLDIRERAEPFHEYMLQRYKLITESVSNDWFSLSVPAFNQEYPRSIYFNDIVPDPRDWRNVCYANYFGLAQISRERQQKKSSHKIKKLRPPSNSYSW